MEKFIRNWAIVFVFQVVFGWLWHSVIFGSQYALHLKDIGRYVDGKPTPVLPYLILSHIIASFGFALCFSKVASSKGEYVGYGALMGLLTFSLFAVLSHAMFPNWTTWLMAMDFSFGIVTGALTGLLLSYFAPKSQV